MVAVMRCFRSGENQGDLMKRKLLSPFGLCFILLLLTQLTAGAQWVQSFRMGNIAYFLFGTSPRIERLALTNQLVINSIWERVRYEDNITSDQSPARFSRVLIEKQ
jgi:hypothetical protein